MTAGPVFAFFRTCESGNQERKIAVQPILKEFRVCNACVRMSVVTCSQWGTLPTLFAIVSRFPSEIYRRGELDACITKLLMRTGSTARLDMLWVVVGRRVPVCAYIPVYIKICLFGD